LPIFQKEYSYKEAKASEGDSPRMSENTISCHNGNGDASVKNSLREGDNFFFILQFLGSITVIPNRVFIRYQKSPSP